MPLAFFLPNTQCLRPERQGLGPPGFFYPVGVGDASYNIIENCTVGGLSETDAL